jgi:predicted metal-dependent enzyme (double-stranded beta helix superfamily)
MKSLVQESTSLDNTIALTNDIINSASQSSNSLAEQRRLLGNTNSNLGKIQTSALAKA